MTLKRSFARPVACGSRSRHYFECARCHRHTRSCTVCNLAFTACAGSGPPTVTDNTGSPALKRRSESAWDRLQYGRQLPLQSPGQATAMVDPERAISPLSGLSGSSENDSALAFNATTVSWLRRRRRRSRQRAGPPLAENRRPHRRRASYAAFILHHQDSPPPAIARSRFDRLHRLRFRGRAIEDKRSPRLRCAWQPTWCPDPSVCSPISRAGPMRLSRAAAQAPAKLSRRVPPPDTAQRSKTPLIHTNCAVSSLHTWSSGRTSGRLIATRCSARNAEAPKS